MIAARTFAGICIFACVLQRAQASGKDEWLCTEEASQVQDDAILSCGVATGVDENAARSQAFDNASAEFHRLCDLSETCKGRKFSVEPNRTSCSEQRSGFKCYRLLTFNLVESKPDEAARAPATLMVPERSEVASDAPGLTANAKSAARLRRNMEKKDLLTTLGPPNAEMESEYAPDRSYLYFKGALCLVENSECTVTIEKNAVIDYRNFKPAIAEELREAP